MSWFVLILSLEFSLFFRGQALSIRFWGRPHLLTPAGRDCLACLGTLGCGPSSRRRQGAAQHDVLARAWSSNKHQPSASYPHNHSATIPQIQTPPPPDLIIDRTRLCSIQQSWLTDTPSPSQPSRPGELRRVITPAVLLAFVTDSRA